MVHAVEQYRRQQLKVKDQEKELQRKLYQMQLDELLIEEKSPSSAEGRPVRSNGTCQYFSACQSTSTMNVHPPAYQTATAPCLEIYKDSKILGGNSATSYDDPCEHKFERH